MCVGFLVGLLTAPSVLRMALLVDVLRALGGWTVRYVHVETTPQVVVMLIAPLALMEGPPSTQEPLAQASVCAPRDMGEQTATSAEGVPTRLVAL